MAVWAAMTPLPPYSSLVGKDESRPHNDVRWGNHLGCMYVRPDWKEPKTLARLFGVHDMLTKLKTSPQIFVAHYLLRLVGSLPNPLCRVIGDASMYKATFSCKFLILVFQKFDANSVNQFPTSQGLRSHFSLQVAPCRT